MSAIFRAGPAHAAIMAALHAQAFDHDPWDEAAFAALLPQPGMLALLHEAGGLLLIRQVLDEAEIITIGVARKRQGIGRALLAEGLARLRALGVVTLFLEVAVENEAAIALYGGFGFVESGRRRAYYENGGDALMMRRDEPGRQS